MSYHKRVAIVLLWWLCFKTHMGHQGRDTEHTWDPEKEKQNTHGTQVKRNRTHMGPRGRDTEYTWNPEEETHNTIKYTQLK